MINQVNKKTNVIPREQWVAVLSKVSEQTVRKTLEGLTVDWKISAKTLPQSGLGMLKMRDSALGDDFYMGEFPLATCWISIHTSQGQEAEGAAWIMDDNTERAEQMALCDGILSERLPGWEQLLELLELGIATETQESKERKSLLAKTRVNFSLLDDAEEKTGEQND